VELAVHSTVAVLTQVADKRGEWWETLGQVQAQARAQHDGDLATFLDLPRQVVEGTPAQRLAGRVPPPFRPAWQALLARLEGKKAGQEG